MKATQILGYTLVGYATKIGTEGNCFDVAVDRDTPVTREEMLKGIARPVKVANLGYESWLATGVPLPLEGEMRGRHFYVTDERIPKEAYRTGELCFCMGGGAMLQSDTDHSRPNPLE